MPALPSTPKYDYGMRLSVKRNVKKVAFGDNYSQRTRDGLNSNKQEWQIKWTRITQAEAESLRTFFGGLDGVNHFTWTPEGQSTELKFIEKSLTIQFRNFDQWDVTLNAEQVFDNT
jgi:phage-related protein